MIYALFESPRNGDAEITDDGVVDLFILVVSSGSAITNDKHGGNGEYVTIPHNWLFLPCS